MVVEREKGSGPIQVRVLPLGPVEERLLQVVAANVYALCDLPAQVAMGGAVPAAAFDSRRRQYDAAVLLKHLDGPRAAAGQKTIAVTAVDIFVPIFSHVFGEARLGGASALVSTHRLSDDGRFNGSYHSDGRRSDGRRSDGRHSDGRTSDRQRDASETTAAELYLRTVKVALHELGHLFQMPHCEDKSCLMHYADTLAAIDATPLQFCRYCRACIPLSGR